MTLCILIAIIVATYVICEHNRRLHSPGLTQAEIASRTANEERWEKQYLSSVDKGEKDMLYLWLKESFDSRKTDRELLLEVLGILRGTK